MLGDARALVCEFRRLGVELFVGSDGVVHGRVQNGKKMPLEAWNLVDELRLVNEAVAGYLDAEPVVELKGVPVDEAVAYAERVKSGDLQLVGKVIFHQSTGLCDLTLRGVIEHGE